MACLLVGTGEVMEVAKRPKRMVAAVKRMFTDFDASKGTDNEKKG